MKYVTVVALELEDLVVVFVVLEADGARRVHVERHVAVRDALHLRDDVYASLAPLARLQRLVHDHEDYVEDERPHDHAHDLQRGRHHRDEVALVLPLHEEAARVLNQDYYLNAKDRPDQKVLSLLAAVALEVHVGGEQKVEGSCEDPKQGEEREHVLHELLLLHTVALLDLDAVYVLGHHGAHESEHHGHHRRLHVLDSANCVLVLGLLALTHASENLAPIIVHNLAKRFRVV